MLDPETEARYEACHAAWAPIWAEGREPYLEVGAGWLPLVAELGEKLVFTCPGLRVVQVKEKFAGLRVYYDGPHDPAVEDLIIAYSNRLQSVCDQCGEPGRTGVRNGWYSTRCPVHAPDGWKQIAEVLAIPDPDQWQVPTDE